MYHRVIIAGTSAGSGKTTITCGILKALMRMNKKVQPFKCGPDCVDTMFHEYITGTKSYNLDKFFAHKDTINWLLNKHTLDADISIIEGAMGIYDGIGVSTEASTFDIARITNTPIILVVNIKGMTTTTVPFIKGLMEYEAGNLIQGVILNRCNKTMYESLKIKIEEELKISVLGYVPIAKEMVIDSKHLGLSLIEDKSRLDKQLMDIHKLISETIDMDAVVKISTLAPEITFKKPTFLKKIETYKSSRVIRIAIAKDNAFNCYYNDNIELLEELGVQVVYFSPLFDKKLPVNIQAIYLGAGYQDNYLKELSGNITMNESIREAYENGLPIIAECGGYMYLSETITDIIGNVHKMVGIIPHNITMTQRVNPNFGYVTMTANNVSAIGKMNFEIKAHVYHYSKTNEVSEGFNVTKPTGKQWRTAYVAENLYAGYPQLYFYSNIDSILNFLKKIAFKQETET